MSVHPPRRVLVVDDSEVTRAILSRTLRAAGFEVLEARDGVEGALTALREQPAVVLTDLEMPVLDGFPLLRLLKTDPVSAHIPVLILTSHAEAASRFWGLRTGADAYLTKDYRPGDLVATVERLIALAPAAPPPAPPQTPAAARKPELGPLDVLARVARQLEASLLQATLLNTLMEGGMAAPGFHEASCAALQTVGSVVDARLLAVAMAEEQSTMLHVALEEPLHRLVVEDLRDRVLQRLGGGTAAAVDLQMSGETGTRQADLDGTVWFSLSFRNARGVMALLPRDPQQFAAGSAPLVEGLAGHLALVLDNARLSQRLRELSTLDGLTGQLNQRAIHDRLTHELERAGRYRQALTVILCDLDHFKQVNDTHGHLAGDTVLREGAAVLRRGLRACDLLGRYGGEEFLAVLPQVDIDAGRMAAERLRRELEGYHVILPTGERVRITASFGVASRDELGGAAEVTGDHLVGLADRRLYQAKAAGRNRVRP
ncbi:MAG TPA: diguanylate cyclase [Thermoanaerobaculia bacterium]|nr:diguanylate cyclase [Thermoanaerobaculia bacterium]